MLIPVEVLAEFYSKKNVRLNTSKIFNIDIMQCSTVLTTGTEVITRYTSLLIV